ncbi:hypothetical protein B0H14DRAFT_3623811 [Mycena olivaceomarginata]|nr:hypothetical protein B0H14DRAFT_3623811 [Mycena olivaceomarginata]
MNSTVTLPSKEGGVQGGVPSKEQKWRSSRMRMSGIRDMLRALTKGGGTPPVPSVITESSSVLHAQHLYQHRQVKQSQSRRAKASAGPDRRLFAQLIDRSRRLIRRPSKRLPLVIRPPLASIFRIGKGKIPPSFAVADASLDNHEVYATFSGISGGRESASNSIGDEEDWDRMEDSASAQRGGSTIQGRSPGSRKSIQDLPVGALARATRLSNVEEHTDGKSTAKAESPLAQLFSRSRLGGKTGSVRSMPPTPPDPKLAMTPENIKPLLENARGVHARLSDCIAEIRSLVAAQKTEK